MSWMRYIEYTGDFSLLVDHKGRNQQNQDSESEEDENFYRAENIDMVDLENETRCLTNLKLYCEDALKEYPQTLD